MKKTAYSLTSFLLILIFVFGIVACDFIDQDSQFIIKLLASDGAEDDLFGRSVAISGDTVIVGAYSDDNGSDSGSAYIFTID